MSDSGKHQAVAKQNSDGTFEFVVETVDDISSVVEEVEASEVIAEPEAPKAGSPIRLLLPILGLLLLIGLGAVGYWLVRSKQPEGEEVNSVPGFKPYSGVAGSANPARTPRVPTPPRPAPADLEPDPAEEVVTNDPGPELDEADGQDEIVEDEHVEADPLPAQQLQVVPLKPNMPNLEKIDVTVTDRIKNSLPDGRLDPSKLPLGLRNANIQRIARDSDGEVISDEDEGEVIETDEEIPEDVEAEGEIDEENQEQEQDDAQE